MYLSISIVAFAHNKDSIMQIDEYSNALYIKKLPNTSCVMIMHLLSFFLLISSDMNYSRIIFLIRLFLLVDASSLLNNLDNTKAFFIFSSLILNCKAYL